jgi:hypothetical protein
MKIIFILLCLTVTLTSFGKTKVSKGINVDLVLEMIQDRTSKSFDLNEDGKIDVLRQYSRDNKIIYHSFDFNFDGKSDWIKTFEDDYIKLTEDTNYDGSFDKLTYQKNNYDKKQFEYYEHRDKNFDGKDDYWVVGRVEKDNIILEIKEDSNFDGSIDREYIKKYPWKNSWNLEDLCLNRPSVNSYDVLKKVASKVKQSAIDYETIKTKYGMEVKESGDGKCSSSLKKSIARKAEASIEKGFRCLANMNNRILLKLAEKLVSNSAPQIQCNTMSSSSACAEATTPGSLIVLGPKSLERNSGCGSLESIIFHEFLHNIGMRGNHFHNHDPDKAIGKGDPVYACQLYCFKQSRYSKKLEHLKKTCQSYND